MAKSFQIPKAKNQTCLALFAHADDLVLFSGGLVRELILKGWQVHSVRVSDDRYDSWGTNEAQAIENNKKEFENAMNILGVQHTYHLDYRSDFFADISETQLRTKFVTLIRTIKPFSILTYDPDSIGSEDNFDHKLVAQTAAESAWISGFDRHLDESAKVEPHLVAEKWYCGRDPLKTTHTFNRTKHSKTLKFAIAAHVTPLLNMQAQWQLIAKTRNIRIEDFKNDPNLIAKFILKNHSVEKYRVIKNQIPNRKGK